MLIGLNRRKHHTGEGYSAEVLADSPIRYYRLGESSGTVATDEKGNQDLTYVNTPTLGATGLVSGDGDTAVTFASASSEYAEADDSALPSAYPITLEALISTISSATEFFLVMVDSGFSNQYIGLRINGGNAQLVKRNTTTYTATSTTSVNDGNPHHIAAVFASATDAKLYVDATEEGTQNNSVTVPALDRISIARIGDVSPGSYFNGTVDEAAIYSTELSAARVQAHATAAGL